MSTGADEAFDGLRVQHGPEVLGARFGVSLRGLRVARGVALRGLRVARGVRWRGSVRSRCGGGLVAGGLRSLAVLVLLLLLPGAVLVLACALRVAFRLLACRVGLGLFRGKHGVTAIHVRHHLAPGVKCARQVVVPVLIVGPRTLAISAHPFGEVQKPRRRVVLRVEHLHGAVVGVEGVDEPLLNLGHVAAVSILAGKALGTDANPRGNGNGRGHVTALRDEGFDRRG